MLPASSLHRFRRPRSTAPKRRAARHSPSPHPHQERPQSSPVFKSGGPRGRRHSPRPGHRGGVTEVLKPVLKYLNLKHLLVLRLVSKEWNDLICHDDSGLWSKGRLCFIQHAIAPSAHTSNKAIAKALSSRFMEFSLSSLITEFSCPNYRFYSVDARFEIVRKFFHDHGKKIENLRLNNCILSLVTFQRILQACPSLQVFEITGMFHCLSHTESLFSSKNESSLIGLINVRKLSFESTYVARLAKQKIHNAKRGARVHFVEELEVQDLHPTVVREILMSATQLESLTFSGFGISTVNRVLHTLSHYPFHHKLVDLEFIDIPDSGSPSCLSEKDDLSHLKLKTFAMTFLGCGRNRNVVLNDQGPGGGALNNLDGVLRNLLLAHQSTLEILDLTNCNVTEAIFLPSDRLTQVPALRKLCLQGTLINELSKNSKYVLRDYFNSSSGVEEEGRNGPMPRTIIDEIIDSALEDERRNSSDGEGKGGGWGGDENGTRFRNCFSFEMIWTAGVFALSILGLFFLFLNWYGDTEGRTIFVVTLAVVIIFLGTYKIVTGSLTD